jgi:antitoxin MazE
MSTTHNPIETGLGPIDGLASRTPSQPLDPCPGRGSPHLRRLIGSASGRDVAQDLASLALERTRSFRRTRLAKRNDIVYTLYLHCFGASSMIVEFCRWGNSLAVRIPKAVADAIKASEGKRAEIKVENGALVLRPIVKPTRKSRYTLDELLSGMTRENVPQEVDWGPRRGNEAW